MTDVEIEVKLIRKVLKLHMVDSEKIDQEITKKFKKIDGTSYKEQSPYTNIFYKSIFRAPVQRVFYWLKGKNENKMCSTLCVIYKYHDTYAYGSFEYGLCDCCHMYPDENSSIEEFFEDLIITNDIDSINFMYDNIHLLECLKVFKGI